MIIPILLFVLGLLLIIFGGDRFVDSAVAIARKLGISEIIIGATIVSLGTTLPEVLVSTTAALQGSADIAAGNAFGSIICNTSLIAGMTQLLRPTPQIVRKDFLRTSLFFFGSAVICLIVGLWKGTYGLLTGILLVAAFGLYAWMNVACSKKAQPSESEETEDSKLGKALITLVITAVMLFIGARLLVDNGILIARALHVPERVIGVTFVALGTSLPELVTAITSIIKGHGAVSVGNILGANILNCVLVMGIPALLCGVTPSHVSIATDIPIAIGVMGILTLPMILGKKGYRLQGAVLLACYAAYCFFQFA